MKSLKSAPGRGVAAGLAGVLVAGAATLLTSAPAQAAAAEGELRWGVSQQFVEHLYFSKMGPVLPTTPTGAVSNGAGHVAGDVATSADDVFTFPAATVTETGGTTVAEYTGTVRGAFVVSGVEQYQVTISDPVVTSDASGNGSIEATVSASNIAAGPNPAASTTPTRVTVAEFAGGTSTEGTLSATPNWSGVLAPGSQTAVDLGISDLARPVDGKSFAPEFLGALTSGVRAHFYFSSSGDHKRPASFTASADAVATVTPTVTSAHKSTGVSVKVDAVDFPAGDHGAYVILAPTGTVIDPDDQAGGMALAVAVNWVTAEQIVGNAFTTVLNAPASKVVKGTDYSIFTIPAHGGDNPDQFTTTPVAVDWAAYDAKLASKTALKVFKKATRKAAGKATVTVTSGALKATGKVKATLKIAGVKKAKVVTVSLKKGKAVVKLPKAKKKGTYTVTVKYLGNATYKASSKKVSFKVK